MATKRSARVRALQAVKATEGNMDEAYAQACLAEQQEAAETLLHIAKELGHVERLLSKGLQAS